MPTPVGFFMDIVNALAPGVGSVLLAGYLVGFIIVFGVFVAVLVAFGSSGESPDGGILFIGAGSGVVLAVVFGLWDSWTLVRTRLAHPQSPGGLSNGNRRIPSQERAR